MKMRTIARCAALLLLLAAVLPGCSAGNGAADTQRPAEESTGMVTQGPAPEGTADAGMVPDSGLLGNSAEGDGLSGQPSENAAGDPASRPEEKAENENGKEGADMRTDLKMTIGGTAVEVDWEDNAAVDALRELAAEGLTVRMSMYGGFEQVGPLGTSLPSDDRQTVTGPGDVVLYAGDRIVVFYGSNSWAYTRLGHITDRTDDELRGLLGSGDVTVTLTAGS